MKPINDFDVQHQGDLQSIGKRTMSLDENSLVHIVNVLTDLYSDPALAVIREYATNAWDSHRAAGNPAAIEIDLPSSLDPTYVVRDYGVGLSVDEVLNIYSKYGASTKRGTDNEVGMLGLGCKAALTYTSQFTVVATKNGVRASVLIARGENGVGTVEVVDTVTTDEPNGVEVRVPVSRVSEFNERAQSFFQYWEKGSVLVNGEEPSLPKDAIQISDDTWVIGSRSDYNGGDRVVMGNVAYPVDSRYGFGRESQYGSARYYAVIRVPIGSVNFTPTREALNYTETTRTVLAEAKAYIAEGVRKTIQAAVDAQPTRHAAAALASSWGGGRLFTYRGEQIVTHLGGTTGWRYNIRHSTAKRVESTLRPLEIRIPVVVGHNKQTLTTKHRLQINKFFQNSGASEVFILQTAEGVEWLNETQVFPWEDIAKVDVSVPRGARPAHLRDGSIEVEHYVVGGSGWVTKRLREVRDDLPFVVLASNSHSGEEYAPNQGLVSMLSGAGLLPTDEYTFLVVKKRSFAKFQRENVTVPLKTIVASIIRRFLRGVEYSERVNVFTDVVRDADVPRHTLALRGQFDDPRLNHLLNVVSPSAEVARKHNQWNTLRRLAEELSINIETPPVPSYSVRALRNAYPLLFLNAYYLDRGIRDKNHLLDYANGLYAYRQSKEA